MRTAFSHLLATALLVFGASSAGAIEITLGGGSSGPLLVGDQVSVTVTLDTETTTGITLFSVGVLFDDITLAYDQDASTTTSYVLYGGKGGGGYLKASSTCGGYPQTAPAGCTIRVGTTDQVNVDFVSVDLTNGTQNTGNVLLATLVFNVMAIGADGDEDIVLSITSPGNVIGQPGGGTATATLTNAGVWDAGMIVVPEPALASLSLAALFTLTALRARGRQRA